MKIIKLNKQTIKIKRGISKMNNHIMKMLMQKNSKKN